MKKIITIIGARPQIIKAAAISRAIKNDFSDKLKEIMQIIDGHSKDVQDKHYHIRFPEDDAQLAQKVHTKAFCGQVQWPSEEEVNSFDRKSDWRWTSSKVYQMRRRSCKKIQPQTG